MPASNMASDMFKQIIDILFTEVFTIPDPSPARFSLAYFHQQSLAWTMCMFVGSYEGQSKLVSAPECS